MEEIVVKINSGGDDDELFCDSGYLFSFLNFVFCYNLFYLYFLYFITPPPSLLREEVMKWTLHPKWTPVVYIEGHSQKKSILSTGKNSKT